MSMESYDLIIVGAGPVGIVVAEQAARKGLSSLIIEKRDHIAGNCYDSFHPNGTHIHNYGPHYFRTDDQEVFDYLSQFTEWIDGNYIVKSEVEGELYSFPINLDTLEKFFEVPELTAETAKELLAREQIQFEQISNSEEFVLSKVGRRLYEAFYLGYTLKQWNKHPSELDPSVCGRIPVKFDRDPYYTVAKHRKMPKDGYTAMFQRMLKNPLIQLRLNTDYFSVVDDLEAKRATVYTGPIDRYFEFCYGKLEWRSLRFEFEGYDQAFKQECAQINYPNDHAYTRSIEIKHVTQQEHPSTVICKEFPQQKGDPYYPVPNERNRQQYLKYKALSEEIEEVYFVGRLAEYTYINSDQAVRKGLDLVKAL